MSKPTYNRCIVTGEELKDGIQNGVDSIYAVAKAAYGVSSGNVFIENRADAPTVSHDGVTNIDVLERSDPIEDMTVATIKQASQRTNKTAGDGTTLSAILSCHLYTWAKRKIEAGMSERQVSEIIKSNVPKILSEISKRTKKDLSDKSLRGVCIVSAGEEALGEMIYDVVKEVGKYGGVNVLYSGTSFISTNVVKGMYIDQGATATVFFNDTTDKRSVIEDCPIVILRHVITRQDEVVPIIEKIHASGYNKVLFVGNIMNDALTFLSKFPKGVLDAMVVAPKSNQFENVLEDIALYTNGKVFSGETIDWTLEDAGCAKSVTVTARETTIVGGQGEDSEELKKVVQELENQLEAAEPDKRLMLEARIARLTAKVANIYVGGASEVEKKETKLRIDDAICAAKSALAGGVVSGGGVCLRDISEVLGLDYLADPFYDLLSNSQIKTDTKFSAGMGYDIKTGRKINMIRSNIIDPAIVIREAVINSHSVVAKLITTTLALTFEDRTWNF